MTWESSSPDPRCDHGEDAPFRGDGPGDRNLPAPRRCGDPDPDHAPCSGWARSAEAGSAEGRLPRRRRNDELREYLEQAQQGENFLPAAFGAVARQVGNELLSKLASKLPDALWAAVAKYLANKSAQFITATEDPKVGVTVKVAFEGIDSLKRLRDIRDGKLASGVGGFLADRLRNIVLPFTALPMPSLSVEAGRT